MGMVFGVILAVVLLPSRRRLAELRNAALVPVPPPDGPLTDHRTAGHGKETPP
jgi:hypothetical protein